ncbi:ubiquitin carboxyl-terminal hydrolase 22-like [Adelges cooleyi]|uniref:ubiquitin carboxyl-terminal hydrolase 22-like n=1 Tax=Adelges cooleyi TaxID=133065 RepID=UPI00217F852C|nr:ubiquitin carboxyl-terminal hydrolase 22-like [Adelges cooleyi]
MASITGCEHFIQQKNDELLNNYRIVHCNFVSCLFENSKKAKKKLAKCHDCKYFGPRLLSCLHCVYFACSLHLIKHYAQTEHGFGINLTAGHLFCAECEDYIYDSDVLSIANSLRKDIYSFQSRPLSVNHINLLRSNNNIKYVNNIPVPGFVNLGNTCFLNSVLQVLMHTPMLRNYVLSDQHVCPNLKDPNRCILCEISRIYQQAYTLEINLIGLQKLLKIFWENTTYMATALQHDAHECYIAILDIIHKQTIKPNENDKDLRHLENCQCIIHKMFRGVLQSDIVCQSCCNISSKIDIINDISIYFALDDKGKYPLSITLMECLEQYGQVELLNDLDCTNCKSKQLSTKQLTLKYLPMVLCFILKRFGQPSDNVSNKITTIVEFPETLNMAKFIEKKTLTGNSFIDECLATYETVYKLYSVICHEGQLNGGHYLSYVRHLGRWYQCNDNVVRIVELDDVLRSPAYLLFYHKEFMNFY